MDKNSQRDEFAQDFLIMIYLVEPWFRFYDDKVGPDRQPTLPLGELCGFYVVTVTILNVGSKNAWMQIIKQLSPKSRSPILVHSLIR